MINPNGTFTYVIKKSKFFAYKFDIDTKEKFNLALEFINAENKDATHICYAYILNNGMSAGMSDDGEPSGSVGRPLLNFLQIKKQTNIAIFVVRYYGGTKLGRGGLTRAYISSVKELFEN